MTATLNTNGKSIRKSLADQIDRLDQILDGLADAINQTVTATVQDAVKDAVQVAIAEVLTNTDLHKHLRGSIVIDNEPDRPAAPSFGQKLKGWVGWVAGAAKVVLSAGLKKAGWLCAKVAGAVKKCWTWAASSTLNVCKKVVKSVRSGWVRLVLIASVVKQLRKPVAVSLAVGSVIGLGCYLAGPAVAASFSALSSVVLTWVAWALRRVWQMLGGVQEPGVM